MNGSSRLQWGLMSTARISSDVIPGLQRSDKNQLAPSHPATCATAEEFAHKNDIPRAFDGIRRDVG